MTRSDSIGVMPSSTSCPTRADVARVLDATYASTHAEGDAGKKVPLWPSGLTRDAGQVLSRIVEREGATRTLETGFALGLSGLWMVHGALGQGLEQKDVRHTAIDPYASKDWRGIGRRLFSAANADSLLDLVQEDSTLVLPRFVGEGRRFDMAFIDGCHLHEYAFLDLYFTSRLVAPGALIVLDDATMPSVATAIRYFVSNLGLVPDAMDGIPKVKRFAYFRTPAQAPVRAWDHFVPF